MLNRFTKLLLVLTMSGLWSIALYILLTLPPVQVQSAAMQSPKDNQELKRLCDEDQSDRTPPAGKSIDRASLGPRDKARLKRVKELYTENRLKTANDYDCAATVPQPGQVPEEFLLAQEFWVVPIRKGKTDRDTLSLVAASEDRFLMNIGRPQRFGTQLRSEGDGPLMLYPVDGGVSDELRRLMIGHSLAEIKAREAEMNRK
jgi:hypothetical protein